MMYFKMLLLLSWITVGWLYKYFKHNYLWKNLMHAMNKLTLNNCSIEYEKWEFDIMVEF